jgi:hypothetical protein
LGHRLDTKLRINFGTQDSGDRSNEARQSEHNELNREEELHYHHNEAGATVKVAHPVRHPMILQASPCSCIVFAQTQISYLSSKRNIAMRDGESVVFYHIDKEKRATQTSPSCSGLPKMEGFSASSSMTASSTSSSSFLTSSSLRFLAEAADSFFGFGVAFGLGVLGVLGVFGVAAFLVDSGAGVSSPFSLAAFFFSSSSCAFLMMRS